MVWPDLNRTISTALEAWCLLFGYPKQYWVVSCRGPLLHRNWNCRWKASVGLHLRRRVFLNRGSTEPLVFDGAFFGVRWKSFNTLTLSGGRWPLGFGRKIGRRKTWWLCFWPPPYFGRKLDVERRGDLRGKLDVKDVTIFCSFIWFWEENWTSKTWWPFFWFPPDFGRKIERHAARF